MSNLVTAVFFFNLTLDLPKDAQMAVWGEKKNKTAATITHQFI